MEGAKTLRMVAPLTADGGGKEDGCPFNSRWRGQRGWLLVEPAEIYIGMSRWRGQREWLPLEQLADCDKVQGLDKARGLRCSIIFEITNIILMETFIKSNCNYLQDTATW